MFVIAGLAVAAVSSPAFVLDGQITIDKALNSPTLTVRYTNANAALVELRVNGESVATRTVNPGRSAGETNFTINLQSLNSGNNQIEIRLFDKAGKLLAAEQTTIAADQNEGPVFLTNPRMGATIRGNIDIKVGFGREMKNTYVSFFIDNQFKSISNVPPFNFSWDTTRDSNGWHEVEAWVVDDSSSTFKTKKVRVFVDNPGGQTKRQGLEPAPQAKQVPPTPVQPQVAGQVKPQSVAPAIAQPKPQAPAITTAVANPILAGVGGVSSSKPAQVKPSIATGPQSMLPTGTRMAPKKIAMQVRPQLPSAAITKGVPNAAATIAITKGQRLPNVGAFAIVYNTQFVDFDVQPRVEDGIPLTPFRYLIEKAGGKVDWASRSKTVSAEADGRNIFLRIGDTFAQINKQRVGLERASYIDHGRTIVPLSFMRDALDVNIEYDKTTGHVLITSAKK